MTEPPRSLIYLPIIYLCTGGVDGDGLASLAPPVHLSGEKLGWTMLVCMVSDFRRGRLEVKWSSASKGHVSTTPYSFAATRRHMGHDAVAMITVVTRDWPSYRCSVSRKLHSRAKRRQHNASLDAYEEIHNEDNEVAGVSVWTNTVVILYMRLILLKTLVSQHSDDLLRCDQMTDTELCSKAHCDRNRNLQTGGIFSQLKSSKSIFGSQEMVRVLTPSRLTDGFMDVLSNTRENVQIHSSTV